MTITRAFIADPPPSGHVQAPPTHAGSNLPADEGVWAAARRSYMAGCSTPVVAERHGLNERTVRRRAAMEGWREARARARFTQERERAAMIAGEPETAEAAMRRLPDLEPFVAAHSFEVGELLMNPEPRRLARFAFRRAAEAAAEGRPAEAQAWMRLAAQGERLDARLGLDHGPYSSADMIRAEYARDLRYSFNQDHGPADGNDDEGDGGEGQG